MKVAHGRADWKNAPKNGYQEAKFDQAKRIKQKILNTKIGNPLCE